MLYSTTFWWGEILANQSFWSFGKEDVGEFTIATLVNLEFGRVKYWRMTFILPNSLKSSPPKLLHYTVYHTTTNNTKYGAITRAWGNYFFTI